MNRTAIRRQLEQAFLQNAPMSEKAYERDLAPNLDEYFASMASDDDDFFFAVTALEEGVGMVLIEKSGEIHVNEIARDRPRTLGPEGYEGNMRAFIAVFAKESRRREIPITEVKVADGKRGWWENVFAPKAPRT